MFPHWSYWILYIAVHGQRVYRVGCYDKDGCFVPFRDVAQRLDRQRRFVLREDFRAKQRRHQAWVATAKELASTMHRLEISHIPDNLSRSTSDSRCQKSAPRGDGSHDAPVSLTLEPR